MKAETKWPPPSRQHLQINNIRTFFQIMAWRRPCDKPLSEPMMVSLLTHICVTRPQWVNDLCTKASKQLNAFTRFSKCLSFYSINLVINNFNNGDYQYSSLVWLRVTGLCAGNSPWPVNSPHKWPVTRENVSIWWRHHLTSHYPNQWWQSFTRGIRHHRFKELITISSILTRSCVNSDINNANGDYASSIVTSWPILIMRYWFTFGNFPWYSALSI